jgi:hypothetical protein
MDSEWIQFKDGLSSVVSWRLTYTWLGVYTQVELNRNSEITVPRKIGSLGWWHSSIVRVSANKLRPWIQPPALLTQEKVKRRLALWQMTQCASEIYRCVLWFLTSFCHKHSKPWPLLGSEAQAFCSLDLLQRLVWLLVPPWATCISRNLMNGLRSHTQGDTCCPSTPEEAH